MTDEQKEQERRDQVVLDHCKAIEAGKKPFTPLVRLNLPPRDICPSCGEKMGWFESRQAFICTRPGCQQPQ